MASSSEDKVYLSQKPQLSTVCALIRAQRWYQLGIQLDMDIATLNDIRDDGSIPFESKRDQMFEKWLRGNAAATNKQLLDALKLKVIGEDALAQEYEERLKREEGSNESNTVDAATHAATPSQNEDNPTREVMVEMSEKAMSVPELTTLALQLQEMYHKLLALVQSSCREAELEPMKNILRSILQEKSLYQLVTITQYRKEINDLKTVDEVFQFLVEKHFLSYLNFQLLKEFSSKTICGLDKSKRIEKELSKYQKHYKVFMSHPEFSKLIQVFDESPHLNPSTIIGLPIIIVSLVGSWKHRNKKQLEEWVPFLQENKVLLQSMGYKCILITYAIFPIHLPNVMSFVNDHQRIQELRENGITIQVSDEAVAMSKLLSSSKETESLQRENAKLKEMLDSVTQTQERMMQVMMQNHDVLMQNQETLTQNQKTLMQNQETLMQNQKALMQNQDKLMQNQDKLVEGQQCPERLLIVQAMKREYEDNNNEYQIIQSGRHPVSLPMRSQSLSDKGRPQFLQLRSHHASYPGTERKRPLSLGSLGEYITLTIRHDWSVQ